MALNASIGIAELNHRSHGHLPGLVGLEITGLGEGWLTSELSLRPELLAPNGYLHAGTVVTLADTSAGYACLAHLPEGARSFTTIELKSNFLGTATQGRIACRAHGVHLGRHTQVWDASVFVADQPDKTLALFRCTQMVLWPKAV